MSVVLPVGRQVEREQIRLFSLLKTITRRVFQTQVFSVLPCSEGITRILKQKYLNPFHKLHIPPKVHPCYGSK